MDIRTNLSEGLKKKPSSNTLVDKLKGEIEGNLNNEQFGVDNLAQSVGMSRSNLHRKLQKIAGASTSQFIREYRLRRALEFLRQEDITVSEAAYRVGFGSSTYFSTCFHKFYGYSPGEVKSRIGNESEILDNLRVLKPTQTSFDVSKVSAKEKARSKKKIVLVFLCILPLLALSLYFYNSTSKASGDIKNSEGVGKLKSLVVLPVKNLTGNPELEYISDGFTDAIISRLSKISDIDKVVPFTSTFKYKQTNQTTEEIIAELGVSALLQSNLQLSGNQIKINLQLIDGHSNNHLWSEEYVKEWKSDEIFKMQTEVVEGIADNMNASISEEELEYIQKIPTEIKQVYTYYLQAEFQRYKGNEAAYDIAMPLYEKAIRQDPSFVEAYLGLASIWSFGGLSWGIYDEQLAWDNAKNLLLKALKLNPSNQEAEEGLYSGYFYYEWDFERVEKYYQTIAKTAIYDEPLIINTDYAIKTGRYKEAIETADKHLLRDPPLIGVLYCLKAQALMFLGNSDEAIELLNITLPDGDDLLYLRESAKLYFYLEEYEKSRIQLSKILKQFSDYPPVLMWLKAVLAHIDGDFKSADHYLGELHAKYTDRSSGSPAWFIALYYCKLKDYESTFQWLQKSFVRHEVEMTWLKEEPLLIPVRNDPRYKDLYKKVGFSKIKN